MTWAAVAALLRELLEKGEIQPEVAAVARDYLSVLERKVLDVGPDVAGLDPVRAWGKKLLHLLRPRLVDRLPDARPTGPITSPSDYVGCYVEFAGPEHEDIKLWLYVTAAGGKYSVPGAPDALWLAIGPPGPALLSKADPPVFELVKDITGFPAWRASLPVDEIQAQGSLEEEVSSTLERVTRLLVLAGVAQTG